MSRNAFLIFVICVLAFAAGCPAQIASDGPAKTESAAKRKWSGGNGCNIFNSEKRKACCTPHDRSYAQGGKEKDRARADKELFRCLWKQNKFAAFWMFVGVKTFGVFWFQYGPKQELVEEK